MIVRGWSRGVTGVFLVIAFSVPIFFLQRHDGVLPAASAQDPKSKGPADAPIRIVEYALFTCSHCRSVQPAVKELLKRYPGKVYYTFRHFGQDGMGLLAHVAAEAAAEQGKFWPYHDRLFEEQPAWTSAADPNSYFIQYARELGLDTERFQRALQSYALAERVLSEYRDAQALGVRIMPTFILQGRMIAGESDFKREADSIVQEILKQR